MKYFIALLTALGFSLAYAADAKKEEPKKAEPAKAEAKKEEPKKEEAKKDGDKPKVKPVGKDGKPAEDKKPAEPAKK
jgi:2',3'-cyclic-nucleotide 2'-phosphodiesterase/3'-nucleotidase